MNIVGAQILPAQAIAPNVKFGTVTMTLRVQTSGTATPTSTPLYSLPVSTARALAAELIEAADKAEAQYGKQPPN
jgi:hypothetical protein